MLSPLNLHTHPHSARSSNSLPTLQRLPIHADTSLPPARQRGQNHRPIRPDRRVPSKHVPSPIASDVPLGLELSQRGGKPTPDTGQVAELGFQGPGASAAAGDAETEDVVCEGGGGTAGPAVRVRDVACVVAVAAGVAVAEVAVDEVAFYHC